MSNSATMSSKGRVVIPAHFRKELGLTPGRKLFFSKEKGKPVISTADWDAIEALCGIYAGMALEEDLIEEKRLEREREERKMEAY